MMGGLNPTHDIPLGTPQAADNACEQSAARARAAQLTKARKWMRRGGKRQKNKPTHDRRMRREVYGDNSLSEATASAQARAEVLTHESVLEGPRRQRGNLDHVDADIDKLAAHDKARRLRQFAADANTPDLLEWAFEKGATREGSRDAAHVAQRQQRAQAA